MNPYIQPALFQPIIKSPDVPMMKLEVPDAASLRKVAFLEIFLYLVVALYVYNKLATKFYVGEISKNQQEYKKNSGNLISSDTEAAGMSRSGGFVEIITRQANVLFGAYKQVFTSIFSSVAKIGVEQGSAINRMRKFMQPLRIFFRSIVEYFYRKLENIMIGSLYMYHKTRDTVKRSFGTFNLVFHTLEHLVNTLQSVPNSTIIQILIAMEKVFGGIKSASNRLCFIDKTPIQLISGEYVFMRDINPGQRLKDGSIVKTKFYFLNDKSEPVYEIPTGESTSGVLTIHASGSHIIYDKYTSGIDKWKYIKDCRMAKKTAIFPDYFYSISTTNNRIHIGPYTFLDYEEISNNPTLVYLINLLQLQHINKTVSNVPLYAYSSIQLDNGLSEHTMVKMMHGGWKKISEIKLGDYLESPSHRMLGETMMLNRVYGVAELHSTIYSKYMWNGILCTGNSKVYESSLDIWMNVEVSMNAKLLEKVKPTIPDSNITMNYHNLFTTSGFFIIYDPVLDREILWRDFNQYNDIEVNEWISDRILSELNYNEIKKTRI